MKKVGKDSTLHERTVQQVAAGQVNVPRRRRQTATRGKARGWNVVVDERVWSQAMELADGDHLRIEVIDATTVVVHNMRLRGAGRQE